MQVEILNNPLETNKEGRKTELTHIKGCDGWKKYSPLFAITRIVYLGKCSQDGDMFAVYYNNMISFCKGNLNDATF